MERSRQLSTTIADSRHCLLLGASTEVPTHDKVMRESPDGQGESELEGPPRICLSVYPKTRICLFYYFMTFTNSSDINGGAIPDHLSLKEINLEL